MNGHDDGESEKGRQYHNQMLHVVVFGLAEASSPICFMCPRQDVIGNHKIGESDHDSPFIGARHFNHEDASCVTVVRSFSPSIFPRMSR